MHAGNVRFEWDEEGKAGINVRKHGVRMPEAYTWRGESIRIISARPAEIHEREEDQAQR
jgi:uncharacterized DUF497 family protein